MSFKSVKAVGNPEEKGTFKEVTWINWIQHKQSSYAPLTMEKNRVVKLLPSVQNYQTQTFFQGTFTKTFINPQIPKLFKMVNDIKKKTLFYEARPTVISKSNIEFIKRPNQTL